MIMWGLITFLNRTVQLYTALLAHLQENVKKKMSLLLFLLGDMPPSFTVHHHATKELVGELV